VVALGAVQGDHADKVQSMLEAYSEGVEWVGRDSDALTQPRGISRPNASFVGRRGYRIQQPLSRIPLMLVRPWYERFRS